MLDEMTEQEQEYFDTDGEAAVEEKTEVKEETKEEPEKESEEKGEEETGEEVVIEDKAEKKKRKLVDYDTFKKADEERKALDAKLRAEADKINRMERTFQQFQQTLAPKQEKPALTPYEEDPALHLAQRQELMEQKMREQEENQKIQIENQRRQADVQNFHRKVSVMEQQFRKDNPEYDKAVEFMRNKRAKELEIAGINDPVQRAHMVDADGIRLAAMALKQGRNPAEIYYEIARNNGFSVTPKEGKVETEAEKKLANVEEGMKKTKSLGATGGKEKASKSLEEFAKMEDSELKGMSEAQIRKMLGG